MRDNWRGKRDGGISFPLKEGQLGAMHLYIHWKAAHKLTLK